MRLGGPNWWRRRAARLCGLPARADRAGERLCADCTRALPWLRGGCPRCGLPAHRGRGCPAARRRSRGRGRRWPTRASRGELVGALKFRGALPVADVMAAQMAANLPAALRDRERRSFRSRARPRRRARGFDPARVLARPRGAASTGRSRTASSAWTGRRARSARAARRAARPGRLLVRVRARRRPRCDPRRRRAHDGRDVGRLRAGLVAEGAPWCWGRFPTRGPCDSHEALRDDAATLRVRPLPPPARIHS